VKGGRFSPHHCAFVPVSSRQRAQLGVSGQETHASVWLERSRAASLSVPTRCLLSCRFTGSHAAPLPPSATIHLTHRLPQNRIKEKYKCPQNPRHKDHRFLSTHTHIHTQTPCKSSDPKSRLLWQFGHLPTPSLHFLLLFWPSVLLSLSDFVMSIYALSFNCVVFKGRLKLPGMHILHHNRSRREATRPAVLCQVSLLERRVFHLLCLSALCLKNA